MYTRLWFLVQKTCAGIRKSVFGDVDRCGGLPANLRPYHPPLLMSIKLVSINQACQHQSSLVSINQACQHQSSLSASIKLVSINQACQHQSRNQGIVIRENVTVLFVCERFLHPFYVCL
jgi:hypothetical protein